MAMTQDAITGVLEDTNYGDNHDYDGSQALEPGTYDYTVTATHGGKLAFKVQTREFEGSDSWVTVVDKAKIRGGQTLGGSFLAESPPADVATVRFNFNREFASQRVGYELEFHKRPVHPL